ncbi:MAG: Trm112 family protein [Candidatus Altiarchaeales archaeon]|nr:MAG: Trm112 family protein [Candidatus Altiarchaeales archaeon]
MDKKLLKIMACPRCKGNLLLKKENLICNTCKLSYHIENEIPIMLIDEADKLK